MTTFTLQDLREILTDSAGEADDVDWDDPTIAGRTFGEIGYDSLALLELSSVVARRYGIQVEEEVFSEDLTPAEAVDYVNECLAGTVAA